MHDSEPLYDVAISFLYQDLALAQALHDQLSKDLKVFFFPRNQEELAGSDGLESMRAPFRSQSRLNVVLYRPKWGNTPWTGVEEAAVKDSCLATSFKSVFFFVIEPTTDLPTWLPETHIRFNYADFTLEQAVGAINAKVQKRGGHFEPMTPLKKLAQLQVEEAYQLDRRRISSSEGLQRIYQNVELLFAEISAQLEDMNANGHLNVQHQTHVRPGDTIQSFILGIQRVGMTIVWFQRSAYSLNEDSALIVRELPVNAIIPPGHMRVKEPEPLKEDLYDPDISRTGDYVWKMRKGQKELISSRDLATRLVLQFLNLLERDRAGKITRKDWRY